MAIKLTDQERTQFISEIQTFFQNERDENLGIVGADMILDFFIKNVGPFIQRQTLNQAKEWFQTKMEDIEVDFDQLY